MNICKYVENKEYKHQYLIDVLEKINDTNLANNEIVISFSGINIFSFDFIELVEVIHEITSIDFLYREVELIKYDNIMKIMYIYVV